ncbi:MAG TPA: class I SAM-dependent methyltransferase [Polyangiales bacterium]|nr:class I SAM-dependent methyltransferase [Polyangiales bacterium]
MRGTIDAWLRYRRIARAFDAARTLSDFVPRGARVLDVGCGNGFIAYHLSALGRDVTGVDLNATTEAPIHYAVFDGRELPFEAVSFDAVIFSFVLHHAPNIAGLLAEARRVLRPDGRIVIYEDIPERWHDRALCLWHEQQWSSRTGPCTFLRVDNWVDLFESLGLRVTQRFQLSRLRNPIHPVLGARFVLEHA